MIQIALTPSEVGCKRAGFGMKPTWIGIQFWLHGSDWLWLQRAAGEGGGEEGSRGALRLAVAPTEADYGWMLSVLQGSEASCTGEATEKGNEPWERKKNNRVRGVFVF